MTITKTNTNLPFLPIYEDFDDDMIAVRDEEGAAAVSSPIYNFIAVEPMHDGKYPAHVYATGASMADAIVSCLIKKEARASMKQRLDELRISVLCRCEECKG